MSFSYEQIREREKGTEALVESCQQELNEFPKVGNEEQVASVTYLLGEYETMLSEFRQHYGL